MSTNSKNRVNEAPLSNFYSNVEVREIMIQSNIWKNNIGKDVQKFSDELNEVIQRVNMYSANLIIPYYHLSARKSGCNSEIQEKTCGILRSGKEGKSKRKIEDVDDYISKANRKDHAIDLLLCSDYKMITRSRSFCFKALGDLDTLKSILIDVLLDEAVYTSYFGSSKLYSEKWADFGTNKKAFILKNQLSSQYRIDKEDLESISSLSIASFCRNGNVFNAKQYILMWERFVNEYYESTVPKVISIEEQLKWHRLYEQLPDNLIKEVKSRPTGAYLILRVNREPKENADIVEAIFGKDASIGQIRIVPLSKFFKEDYQILIRNLDVSAFKIIKRDD